MTVDQDIARPLLALSEIEQLESIGENASANSIDLDTYYVILLRYAERIMFSPWMEGNSRRSNAVDPDLSDRASAELTRIRKEIERIDRKAASARSAQQASADLGSISSG